MRAREAQADLWEPHVHAVLTRVPGGIRRTARRRSPQGRARSAGVPVRSRTTSARRLPTTCGSRILAGYLPPYDATVVAPPAGAGARIVGKGNMDEFAMGSSTEIQRYGPTRNPYDLARVPGGSSGGPAAAVAYGLVPDRARLRHRRLGAPAGGVLRRVRAQADLRAAVALRAGGVRLVARPGGHLRAPRRRRGARVPRRWRGPIRSTPPRARVRRPTSTRSPGTRACEGLRFGWPANLWREGVDADVVEGSSDVGGGARARRRDRRVPFDFLPGEYVGRDLLPGRHRRGQLDNLARFDGVRYGLRQPAPRPARPLHASTRSAGFGAEVQRRILLGTYALSAGYYDAYYLHRAARAHADPQRVSPPRSRAATSLLMPAAPTLPFRLGEKTDDPLAMYLSDIFTIGANLAGIPA